MIPETFWAYLAGFFDGEGHLSTRWSGFTIKITQSGEEGRALLSEIQSVFKHSCSLKGHINLRRLGDMGGNLLKKPSSPRSYWELNVCHRDSVEYILKKIFPYLHIKKLVCQDALRYCKMYSRITRGYIMRIDTVQCPNGHPYTQENTIWRKKPNGLTGRACRTCKREKDRRGRDKRVA